MFGSWDVKVVFKTSAKNSVDAGGDLFESSRKTKKDERERESRTLFDGRGREQAGPGTEQTSHPYKTTPVSSCSRTWGWVRVQRWCSPRRARCGRPTFFGFCSIAWLTLSPSLLRY